jgi:16S rRNA (adenine1518-N6/adenine1519-N6)-dimethyltransferase
LDDQVVLREIVQAAEISAGDFILEIGPGLGSLTRFLATNAHRVVGVEVDAALAAICRTELKELANVKIIHGDALEIAPAQLGLPQGYLVVANIPYYITSPILRHLLEAEPRPRRIVLTVQKEVAARVCSKPPEMSLLAVSVQVHGAARLVSEIPARAFHPRPRVDSAILRIDCFDQPRVGPAALDEFFRTVKAGFLQPRKMLRNSMAAGLHLPPADVETLLRGAGLDARRRAETLTIEEWIQVTDMFRPSAE